jgi:hypothetical protein
MRLNKFTSQSMDLDTNSFYYENTLQAVANCLGDEEYRDLRRNSHSHFDPTLLNVIQEEDDG